MNAARYDYLILVGDDDDATFLRNHTAGEVQQHIEDHISHKLHFRVRQVSLDEFARDVTDDFENPRCPAFDRESSRADYLHQMEMEGAL